MASKIIFLNQHDTKRNLFKPHRHTCYEIVYFLTGSGQTIIDTIRYPVSENSYCLIAPDTPHLECIEGYGEILFIGFEYNNPDYPLAEGVYHNAEITLLPLFQDIFREYKEQKPNYETAAHALLDLLLVRTLRHVYPSADKGKDLHYIKSYIEQHFDQKISFKELASISGYSSDHFRHIFKQKFGFSPQEYLIHIRLENARLLLESTELSCTDIAYCCGFSTAAQFSSMFRKKYDFSPSEFKTTDFCKNIRDL